MKTSHIDTTVKVVRECPCGCKFAVFTMADRDGDNIHCPVCLKLQEVTHGKD